LSDWHADSLENGDTSKSLGLINADHKFITLSGEDILDEEFHSIVDHEKNDPLFFDEMPTDKQHPKVQNGEVETQDMFLARSFKVNQEIIDHNKVAQKFIEEHMTPQEL